MNESATISTEEISLVQINLSNTIFGDISIIRNKFHCIPSFVLYVFFPSHEEYWLQSLNFVQTAVQLLSTI